MEGGKLLLSLVPLRCALVRHLQVRVVNFAVAAHVVAPLLAAPRDGALNRQSLYPLFARCPHAKLAKKKPVCAGNGLHLGLPPLYALHP